MDVSRLKRLATKEDFFHVHKTLGILSLCHFLYRVVYDFRERDGSNITLWLFIHISLSTSSLLFHIPKNRVRSLPMIWPEFRIHSIIFALRSLLACLVVLHIENMWMNALIRHILVIATLCAADGTTAYYKHHDNKLGTTMRGMPMPDWFSAEGQKWLNFYYSFSQVLATLTVIVLRSENPLGQVFWTVFPIQIAPFLMTLTRKGFLSSFGWHFGYALALFWNYVYGAIQPGMFPFYYWMYALVFCVGRFHFKVNKYILWSLICVCNMMICE